MFTAEHRYRIISLCTNTFQIKFFVKIEPIKDSANVSHLTELPRRDNISHVLCLVEQLWKRFISLKATNRDSCIRIFSSKFRLRTYILQDVDMFNQRSSELTMLEFGVQI